MHIIHSLTAVRISDACIVDIPTFYLHLPLTKKPEGNGWTDLEGNDIASPGLYLQELMSLNGFNEIDYSQHYDLSKSKGAWEICGMQDNQVLFASLIQNEDEVLNRDQVEWLRTALESGLSTENFALIEVE